MTTRAEVDRYDEAASPSAMPTAVLLLIAALAGVGIAALVLPRWLPAMSASLLGAQPKGFWYASRASAFVAYLLLWLSMATGLFITNRMARAWPGGPTAFDLHQHTSLLGMAFAGFHALVLLGDRYIGYTLRTLAVPFSGQDYRPLPVGLGQLALYGAVVVSLSFYARDRMGPRHWRVLHYLSFAVYVLALGHAVLSGTDSSSGWARWMYWLTAGSLVFLTVYRVLVTAGAAGVEGPRNGAAPPSAVSRN